MVQTGVRNARVVAIDDSPKFLSSLKSYFEQAPDFELVGTAQNGFEGLALVRDLSPDLVLMDVQMPGMNGLEATSEIRQRFPGIPVVIVTAHDLPVLRHACSENGAAGFVAKSTLNQELPDVLAKVLVLPSK